MIAALAEMLRHPFLARALLVGLLVSLCAALPGVCLVLKRYSMIGDGLSHVGFGALAVASALNAAPLTITIPVVVAAAFILLRLGENSRIKGDAAIAMLSAASLAVGVTVVSLYGGMNTDVESYLFGSITAVAKEDVPFCMALAAAALLLYGLLYHRVFAVTFDEGFAKATGGRTGLHNTLLALLTAATVVLGMRTMGALLISSLMIFPALSAMRLFKSFRGVTLCAALVAVFCFLTGMTGAFAFSAPPGAAVVLVNAAVFVLFWLLSHLPRLLRGHGRPMNEQSADKS